MSLDVILPRRFGRTMLGRFVDAARRGFKPKQRSFEPFRFEFCDGPHIGSNNTLDKPWAEDIHFSRPRWYRRIWSDLESFIHYRFLGTYGLPAIDEPKVKEVE